jgi:serine/threonine protein phosphatase PrpC
MEDRCVAQHCALNGGRAHFAALFDGHNGAHAAALAVVAFRDALASRLGRERGGGAAELGAELYDAFGSLNEALRARSDEMGRGEDGLPIDSLSAPSVGGTTAIVAVLDGDVAHIAGVGDSRAVLARGARAVRVSTDHKPKLPAEEERIVEAGGFVARGRVHGILSVSRSLGDFEFAPLVVAEPHVLSFRLAPDDRCLLLASDGLWDVLSDDEAIEIALRVGTGAAADPAAASQLLVDEALRRGSRDNVSVVCVFLGVGRTASESD